MDGPAKAESSLDIGLNYRPDLALAFIIVFLVFHLSFTS